MSKLEGPAGADPYQTRLQEALLSAVPA